VLYSLAGEMPGRKHQLLGTVAQCSIHHAQHAYRVAGAARSSWLHSRVAGTGAPFVGATDKCCTIVRRKHPASWSKLTRGVLPCPVVCCAAVSCYGVLCSCRFGDCHRE
jgi:hypothetical protein